MVMHLHYQVNESALLGRMAALALAEEWLQIELIPQSETANLRKQGTNVRIISHPF